MKLLRLIIYVLVTCSNLAAQASFETPLFSVPAIYPASDLSFSEPNNSQIDSNKIHIVVLGDGYNAFDEILLYPNPSNTILTIQSSAIKPGTLVFLNDLSGRLIQKIALHESENFQLNTQHLANGTYWLSIQGSDGKQHQERFIVMHE